MLPLSKSLVLLVVATVAGCATNDSDPTGQEEGTDITDAAFSDRTASCAARVGHYTATARDLTRDLDFSATVDIEVQGESCVLSSNGIPNHDFNDTGAFATAVSEVVESFTLPQTPTAAGNSTALSLQYDNGVFLNGVKLDLLAAACYGIGDQPLGEEKIGCMSEGTPWRYDPMSPRANFGTDAHNAHTQPDGAYHYHGDPVALYDDSGAAASGVIGYAADGFPIFGPWIEDGGTVRKAVSGYTLREGERVSQEGEGAFPGGTYDGTYVDDYEFSGAGDLDECNGTTRDGEYGYYVTDGYPWIIGCFVGTPDSSFRKGG
ncbi:MAG: YHYH protein [Nannocystales bacterium]